MSNLYPSVSAQSSANLQAVLVWEHGLDKPPTFYPLASSAEQTERITELLNRKFRKTNAAAGMLRCFRSIP
jgi:hypothetical protein